MTRSLNQPYRLELCGSAIVSAQADCDARVSMGSVRGGWWEWYLYVEICDKKHPIDEAEKGTFNCILGRSVKPSQTKS